VGGGEKFMFIMRLEALNAETMTSTVFLDVRPCSLYTDVSEKPIAYNFFSELQSGRYLSAFRRNPLPPYSTLKTEAEYFSETFRNMYQTTQRHILQDGNLHLCSYFP
jgi:hypothetical protein